MKRVVLYCIALSLLGLPLIAEEISPQREGELFIAIFVLGGIGILALIVSSFRLKKVEKEYKKIEQSSKDLEEKQSELISNMSNDIQAMVKKTISNTHAIADKIPSKELGQELNNVLQAENQLLDIANDLIEFLHLKAKKVKTINEPYKLDNLLNDITGFIGKNTQRKSLELTYQIDRNIPNELIGDTLKISKILYNLLDYTIRNGATNLLLHIHTAPGFQSKNELLFSIETNLKSDVESDAFFFNAHYNEKKHRYDSLGLFVAQKLAMLVDGELIARNDKNGMLQFMFSMAFMPQDNVPKKRYDERILNKKTLIIDSSDASANALAEMLESCKYKVNILKPDEFFQKESTFHEYDLIMLDEKLFSVSVTKALEKLDKQKVKIIAISNFFNPVNAQYYTKIADYKFLKPNTRGALRRLLETIYLPEDARSTAKTQSRKSTQLKVYTESFAKTPGVTLETFALFKGNKLLIVEDDIINQKVIKGMLKRSEMEIDLANNGEECIALLEKKGHYDLILMDINMPTMDGFTATRLIRAQSQYDNVPILSLTSLNSPDEINKMFDCGMNAHLAKPFHKDNLFSAFDMFLKVTNDAIEFPKVKEEKPAHYEGLDIQKGIRQTNNNEDFYKEVLSEFLDNYENSAQVYEKLIYDFRYEQIRLYCLDIKGLSGLIGAMTLHDLMVEIHNKLIYKKFDMLEEYVPAFKDTVHTVSESIRAYIES